MTDLSQLITVFGNKKSLAGSQLIITSRPRLLECVCVCGEVICVLVTHQTVVLVDILFGEGVKVSRMTGGKETTFKI